ncbi:MAG: hypothetical protein Kow0019_07970 [Methanobacteriaceae archaeon]
MPKKSNLKDTVLNLLKDKDLSRKDINLALREVYSKKFSDKTLNEVLVKLLREEKIGVVGYDLNIYNGMKRVQSLKPDGMIFGSFKYEQFEMEILFKKLDSEDLETVKNAHSQLKKIFFNRLKTIEEKNNLKQYDIEIKEEIFENLIYYINSQDQEQKNTLKEKLIWALSNKEDSDKLLAQIIKLSALYSSNR